MTNKKRETPFAPIVKVNEGHLFNINGKTFLVKEKTVEESQPNFLLKELVTVNERFNVNPNSISFYCGGGTIISGKDEENNEISEMVKNSRYESVKNSQKLVNEQAKLQALNEKRDEYNKQYLKDFGQEEIVESIKQLDHEISEKKNEINELKKKPLMSYFFYDSSKNKIYINGNEIDENKSVSQYCLENGLISYEYKPYLESFETAVNNFNCYQHLGFCTKILENNLLLIPMKVSENTYIFRYNYDTQLSEFKNIKANDLVDYVIESTGEDITYLVEDIINEEKTFEQEKNERINELNEMLSFLYEKKEQAQNVDVQTSEIKQAINLLDEEINEISTNIKVLEAEELSRDNGYVKAVVRNDTDALDKGSIVKVDAMDFTNAGKTDYVSTYIDGDHIKLQKFDLELKSDEIF